MGRFCLSITCVTSTFYFLKDDSVPHIATYVDRAFENSIFFSCSVRSWGPDFKYFITLSLCWLKRSSPLLNSVSWIPSAWIFSAALCWFLPTSACVLGSFYPQLSWSQRKQGSFLLRTFGSVPTGQTVGTKVISFLAIGMFPKLPIGIFQVFGIFIRCALDQIHSFWKICLANSPSSFFTLSDLHVGEVHIII